MAAHPEGAPPPSSAAAADEDDVGFWGKISQGFDKAADAIIPDFVAEPNKVGEFFGKVAKAPRSLVKGTGNALGMRQPQNKARGKRPPPIDSIRASIPAPVALSPVQEASKESTEASEAAVPPQSKYLLGPVEFGIGTMILEEDPNLAIPRMIIRTEKKPVTDEGFSKMFEAMSMVLDRGQPFTALYDVRNCRLPGRKQITIGQDWGQKNNKRLNQLLQGIVILNSSAITRSTVNMILAICKPPQPCGLFGDEDAAYAFARDKCSKVRVWSKKDKKRREPDDEPTTPPLSKRASREDSLKVPTHAPDETEADDAKHDKVPHSGTVTNEDPAPQNKGSYLPPVSGDEQTRSVERMNARIKVRMHEMNAKGRENSGRMQMAQLAANDRKAYEARALTAAQVSTFPITYKCSLLLTRPALCCTVPSDKDDGSRPGLGQKQLSAPCVQQLQRAT